MSAAITATMASIGNEPPPPLEDAVSTLPSSEIPMFQVSVLPKMLSALLDVISPGSVSM